MKKINQYKNAQLSDKELDEFTGNMIRAKFRKEKEKKWAQQLSELHGVEREEDKSVNFQRKSLTRYIWVIAASLLFLVTAFFVIQYSSKPNALQLAESYLQENKFPNPILTKGQIETSMLELKMAEVYNRGNFEKAIQLGKQLTGKEDASVSSHFFLGLSYLYNNDPENARTSLLKFRMENKVKQFDQESRWFLALAYVKLKEFKKAKQELEYIVNKKEWNLKLAQQLLKELETSQ